MRSFITGCLLCCSLYVQAQVVTYETAKKKAQSNFDNAVAAIREYRDDEAIHFLQEAIRIEPNFSDAYGQMGISYVTLKKYTAAIASFEKLKQLDSAGLRPAMLAYSRALAGNGRFADALQMIDQYLQSGKSKSPKAAKLKENYEFALKAATQVPFEPHNLGDGINTKDPEYFPSLTIDDKTLIFTRRVNGKNEDFFISQKDSVHWQAAKDMGEPVNTAFNEGAQQISQDGEMLVFTGCEFPDGKGSCDIYFSMKTKNGWEAPQNMGMPINTRDWESQPCLSVDKQTLYFVRETAGNGADIFMSRRLPNGRWGVPERLGPNINTPGRETTPFIHADNQTLFFASNGHPGYGGMDLFYSRRQPDGSWGPAINLGYPINTIDEDASLIVAADGRTAYFASDRTDSHGTLDIYSFELYPAARPLPTLYVKGYVYDAKTQQRLTADLELTDLESGFTLAKVKCNDSGQYLVPLPVGKSYAFNVNKRGYLFYSDNFTLPTAQTGTPPEKNIPLQPIEANATIVLHNIFFESKQITLQPASQIELDKLVQLLQDNPGLVTEISGHTDNVGSDQDNLLLSANRAKAVVAYLTQKGIAAERLRAKGYGETQPVADNNTEDGRAQNRRTEFKVISL
ncbi:OmpA family protein [Chitinophaga agrisoli]|uniref:OmpA family protein n=1 Tax=Chitinophaga agrisoli TaxID=2607653 RepID=A0A5B2VP03_9BACT|nr:OmpA family protein [Chitinophaga agrisoli]KAA2240524.1 OmpA family protein [Chitinophaga agrisoli]